MKETALVRFRLYVAGEAPNSIRAKANLRTLCDERLPGRHSIEIVDVAAAPERALEDHVMVTPTLVKLSPGTRCTVIGNLSNLGELLANLGLSSLPR